MKLNKKDFIISLLCFLPILYCIYFYNVLPENIPTHFDINGNVNGYTKKNIFIFVIPIFMYIINVVSSIFIKNDPLRNKENIISKYYIYIIPIIINILFAVSISVALGKNLNINFIISFTLGILFIFLGNYMPKCEKNYTIGIRTPWSLNSEKNWKMTHKFAGRIYVLAGFILFIEPFFKIFSYIIMMILLILPIIYSFYIYLKYDKKQ